MVRLAQALGRVISVSLRLFIDKVRFLAHLHGLAFYR